MSTPRPPAVGDHVAVLLRAWELDRARDSVGLRAYLQALPEALLVAEPDLGVMLISACILNYDAAEARRVAALLEPGMATRPNDRLHRRFVNWQGVLLTREGRLSAAEERLREVEWMSVAAGDELVQLFAATNLAVVADIRCEYATSLLLNQRALVLARLVGKSRSIGVIHHHLAMTYRQLGLYAEASRHFERSGLEWVFTGERPALQMERAILRHLMGEHAVAEALVRLALEGYRTMGSASGTADALRVLGMILAGRGDPGAALEPLREARELVSDDPLIRGEVHEELAVAHALLGNMVDSLEAESTAAAIYTGMEAPRRAERMRVRLATLELEKGD